jgi:hypothetical protein
MFEPGLAYLPGRTIQTMINNLWTTPNDLDIKSFRNAQRSRT